MALLRTMEPEWLDEIPADDFRAIRSRRDLKRINAFMLQTAILARLLTRHQTTPPRRIIELGSGDGTFMLGVARRLASVWPEVHVVFLDRQNIVSDETRENFRALNWQTESVSADVFDFLSAQKPGSADIVTANLFLHHFSEQALSRLFAFAAQLAPLFVACEPRRSSSALIASHMVIALGCNDVSRHDAVVSVRAGFSGQELSKLWPQDRGWNLQEQPALPFTHCFAARRIERAGHADV
ncbi:MAG TPA: methyltransferase domain-containing protein [Micropepsaceae bacterium]